MSDKKITLLNPFRIMGFESEDIIPAGGLGAVVAQAGVGKTALLVQLAISSMLRGEKVLHISLHDPVHKVSLWYQELFNNMARQAGWEGASETWEATLSNRFIMTFKVEGFNVPKLKERLTDLTVQNIFLPEIVIIDGLKFDEKARETLEGLKAMAERYALRLWFTVHTSPQEATRDVPPALKPLLHLFDCVFTLRHEGGEICARPLHGGRLATKPLYLDPSTMLIKNLLSV